MIYFTDIYKRECEKVCWCGIWILNPSLFSFCALFLFCSGCRFSVYIYDVERFKPILCIIFHPCLFYVIFSKLLLFFCFVGFVVVLCKATYSIHTLLAISLPLTFATQCLAALFFLFTVHVPFASKMALEVSIFWMLNVWLNAVVEDKEWTR